LLKTAKLLCASHALAGWWYFALWYYWGVILYQNIQVIYCTTTWLYIWNHFLIPVLSLSWIIAGFTNILRSRNWLQPGMFSSQWCHEYKLTQALHSKMWCKSFPPYSSNFILIKLALSAMKYHLCRNGNYAWMAITHMSDKELFITLLRLLYICHHACRHAWMVCTLWLCIIDSWIFTMHWLVNTNCGICNIHFVLFFLIYSSQVPPPTPTDHFMSILSG